MSVELSDDQVQQALEAIIATAAKSIISCEEGASKFDESKEGPVSTSLATATSEVSPPEKKSADDESIKDVDDEYSIECETITHVIQVKEASDGADEETFSTAITLLATTILPFKRVRDKATDSSASFHDFRRLDIETVDVHIVDGEEKCIPRCSKVFESGSSLRLTNGDDCILLMFSVPITIPDRSIQPVLIAHVMHLAELQELYSTVFNELKVKV